VEALAEPGDYPGSVHASNRETERVLLAAATTVSRFGDGKPCAGKKPRTAGALHIDGARERTYALEASLAALKELVRIRALRVMRQAGRRVRVFGGLRAGS
jgi:hypothetical protein